MTLDPRACPARALRRRNRAQPIRRALASLGLVAWCATMGAAYYAGTLAAWSQLVEAIR